MGSAPQLLLKVRTALEVRLGINPGAKLCFSCALSRASKVSVQQEPNPRTVFPDLYRLSEAELCFLLHLFLATNYLESRRFR